MADEASIDNETLISLVEQSPVVWDRSNELYKNRVATQAAWRDIMIALDPTLETKDETTRQAFAKLIIQRWTYIRDTYHRSCKKIQDQKRSGSGSKITKPYLYSKQLRFLQKVIHPDQPITVVKIESNNSESDVYDNNLDANETWETNSTGTHEPPSSSKSTPERAPNTHTNADLPSHTKMMKMDTYLNNEPQTMNRHLSFFNGILPALDELHEDEVLDFQIGVLHLLKKIRSSRQNQNP
ncbi:uncharacterized protein LOC125236436 [Leguminivora glycinivorella]|uniref:uncharacterized protein LOC125236436 n=1 Tax=Leguminivora glycinivorella TaxID=1035111 RepID=UPI0020107E27|nr:uncharacterized protein LOC125236436 [Leguminivora glycinivorella]